MGSMQMSEFRSKYPDMPTLLAAIRMHPGMFLGTKTITGMHLLLLGISNAEDFHGLAPEGRIGGLDRVSFEQWVMSQHNPHRLSLNSFYLARHIAGGEDVGFDLWFTWYDEFLLRRR